MTRKHRRRHQGGFGVLGWLNRNLARLRTHPLRAGLLGTVGLVLAWLTLTKSLPFALAPSAPDLALALNASNPAALIAKARQTQRAYVGPKRESANANEHGAVSQPINTLEKLPEAGSNGAWKSLAASARPCARKSGSSRLVHLRADPLNAEAYELLGLVSKEPERVRALMQEAVDLSRRESSALFWLLNESFYRRDYRATLDYARSTA